MPETFLPSNRGRWGEEDHLGTLNLIDDAARARAAAEVHTGRHVSLARVTAPIGFTAGLSPLGSPATMPAAVLHTMNFTGFRPLAVTDALIINTHNAGLTHLDAFAHIPVDGSVFPGVPVEEAISPAGVRRGSAEVFTAGIVTRGVLLDLAPDRPLADGHRVGPSDLQSALDRSGSELLPGDAAVVRGGWDTDVPAGQPVPGLELDAVRWLGEHDVSLYLGDIGDARPPSFPLPLHQVALARLGLPLVDAAALDELAQMCAAEQRWTFLLVLAPPRITGTTGLAVNPVALF